MSLNVITNKGEMYHCALEIEAKSLCFPFKCRIHSDWLKHCGQYQAVEEELQQWASRCWCRWLQLCLRSTSTPSMGTFSCVFSVVLYSYLAYAVLRILAIYETVKDVMLFWRCVLLIYLSESLGSITLTCYPWKFRAGVSKHPEKCASCNMVVTHLGHFLKNEMPSYSSLLSQIASTLIQFINFYLEQEHCI